jgi:hypothetical protein
MDPLTGGASLAVVAPHAPPTKRMPRVVDDDLLPDMGRVTLEPLRGAIMPRCG